ncbi:MAG: hypothetical protein ACT4PZ_23740 [Panacagrimonas sp.]
MDDTLPASDVDFFRLSLTPGTRVSATLIGNSSGGGEALGDAFMGLFFDGPDGCQLQTVNDDGAGAGGALIRFDVPASGVVILAATGCCDGGFTGDHTRAGAYTLTVRELIEGTISGRVTDARNGAPLSGDFPTNAQLEIEQCESAEPESNCFEAFAHRNVGSDGRFSYPVNSLDTPLEVGRSYRLRVRASAFEEVLTRFTVADASTIEVGDLALPAIKLIRRIRARLLEQVTRARIPGDSFPFGRIALLSCDETGKSCSFVNEGATDSTGTLRFPGNDGFGRLLQPGMYRIEGHSGEHSVRRSDPFQVGEDQVVTVEMKLRSRFPVKLSEVRPCGAPPTEGGPCTYSARVTNITREPVKGTSWSLVEANDLGSPSNHTQFQTGEPQRFDLPVGGSAVIQFQFEVPAELEDGVNLCADIFVSRGSGPVSSLYFETAREADLFCVRKGPAGEFLLATQAEARAIRADAAARRAAAQSAPVQKSR